MSKQSKNNPVKDIEELERRLKNWNWIKDTTTNDDLVNLAQCRDILNETGDLKDPEDDMKMLGLEAQDFVSILKQELDVAKFKISQCKTKLEILSQEAQNKILYKMDSEDIRSSLWKIVVSRKRLSIFEDGEQLYSALLDSLNDLLKIQQSHWVTIRQKRAAITPYLRKVVQEESEKNKELIPISKILYSQFYEMKVRARLTYEDLSQKTLDLSKKLFDKDSFNLEIIREHTKQEAYLSVQTNSKSVPVTTEFR